MCVKQREKRLLKILFILLPVYNTQNTHKISSSLGKLIFYTCLYNGNFSKFCYYFCQVQQDMILEHDISCK